MLALSSIAWCLLVLVLYLSAWELHRLIGFPYRRAELALQDWVAKRARTARL
jgi:hypothetical protein